MPTPLFRLDLTRHLDGLLARAFTPLGIYPFENRAKREARTQHVRWV